MVFVKSKLEDFKYENYDFINAIFLLPFINKNMSEKTMKKILSSINPECRLFFVQLFGIKDSWNTSKSMMNFHTREDVQDIFSEFRLISFEEEERKVWYNSSREIKKLACFSYNSSEALMSLLNYNYSLYHNIKIGNSNTLIHYDLY